MVSTTMDRAWDILGWVFVLNGEVFQRIITLPKGMTLAISVVLLAGLSLAVGQGIILFINRVQPTRFVFTLLVNAILYLFEFLFLVLSTWFICLFTKSVNLSLPTLLIVLGLSYAPLLFSFLGALPYLGFPLLRILSIWHLLAMVVGFGAVANMGAGFAFGYVALGWFVRELLEHTVGQPIAHFGKTIVDWVAGVDLANNRTELRQRVETGLGGVSSPMVAASQKTFPEVNQLILASDRSHPEAAQAVAQAVAAQSSTSAAIALDPNSQRSDPLVRLAFQTSSVPKPLKLLLSLLCFVALFVLVAIFLRPIRNGVFGWYQTLPVIPRLIFDLSWIGVVAIIFAGLLAPFETLGWWAGWFGDEVDTTQVTSPAPELGQSPSGDDTISRYVIYLDGVGQSGEAHTPDVEDFLTVLDPALPPDVKLVQGLMMYSVLNKPLNEDRPLAFLWKLADKMRWKNPMALLGLLVNMRNALIVMVSADKRYGPIYNRGIAQVLYNGLIKRGYPSRSGIPITLIGYSGGAQMSAASAPYLKQALEAPIDVISLGGVMSANNNFLRLEHLYHVVGEKDVVQRLGPLLFPGRWKIFPLSFWNRAQRKGKISILSAGPVGHQVPGGYMDPQAFLPDGRSYLQQTVETILQILSGNLADAEQRFAVKTSNYAHYKQADFNDPAYYPLNQTVDLSCYRAIAPWMGRLILPNRDDRSAIRGVLFEVHHAAAGYEHLVGQIVKLRWVDNPAVKNLVMAARRDLHFSADAEYSSRYGGLIHPERLNRWQQVGPLESLAGSRPMDDMVVMLNEPVEIRDEGGGMRAETTNFHPPSPIPHPSISLPHPSISLFIRSQPVQITGRFCALVRFVQPIAGTDQFRVVHFNRATRQFDGAEEIVRLPAVMIAEAYGSAPSTTHELEKSPFNETGWYIYGAKDAQGFFVVQSLGPRALFRLQPDEVVFGRKASYQYIRKRSWANIKAQKGRISSVLCVGRNDSSMAAIQTAIDAWQEGDRALVLHVYGGIGGKQAEPAAATPIFFGHFAIGVAKVVHEPLCDELRFDLRYHQVYTHNTDGLVAGTLHWSRYMGDRQFGWLGDRPVCDILIKHDSFTGYYDFSIGRQSPLDYMLAQLEVMTARYRIGDGTGGTYVGAASNCAQDSNQALFASLRQIERQVYANAEALQRWAEQNPAQAERFAELIQLGRELKSKLQPLSGANSSWERNEYNLGSTLEDDPIRNLITGLGSWRTMLPRLASDTVVKVFLDHGASVWVLRTNQIGGYDPNIEPIAPMTL
ncbi:CAAX protease (plasmid) [Kovacikia minuta CCNUW1]|uniref:CAAX protease n=1 Tax=Kovacikia minuta TaxID=2931930 RepID=UPI001CC9EFC2|nr:CAAX protease [Kovacikia minuta]UBF30025.1 CAAX protease [Kovacikia minuta CCNUW1]